uniref:DUF4177 domain-containing protein n=1 Tax=viral metagenome TaxID=1070528 RepID=A0A6M3JNJ6_9ZZZZ
MVEYKIVPVKRILLEDDLNKYAEENWRLKCFSCIGEYQYIYYFERKLTEM